MALNRVEWWKSIYTADSNLLIKGSYNQPQLVDKGFMQTHPNFLGLSLHELSGVSNNVVALATFAHKRKVSSRKKVE